MKHRPVVENQEFPLITVLIPVYNTERFVSQALDSVLMDSYPHKEIAVINDGSSDNSEGEIRRWIELHREALPIHHRSRPNLGITRTLNEAMRIAEGSYFALLASDDVLIDGGLTARYEYLKRNPQKLAVIGDCNVVNECGQKLHDSLLFEYRHGVRELFATNAGTRRQFIRHWFGVGPSLMFDRRLIDRIGAFDESLKAEDLDFFLRMSGANLIGFVDAIVGAYRVHGSNTSTNAAFIDMASEESARVARKNMRLFRFHERLGLIRCFIYPAVRRKIRRQAERTAATRWLVPVVRALLRWSRAVRGIPQ